MQENHSFEYAIIRLVPRVERGEFLNVGVILYCQKHQFLQIRSMLDEKRALSIYPGLDVSEVSLHLEAFDKICIGNGQSGSIGALDIASRFRWLTAKRSTVVQVSDVHPGICKDPGKELEKLYKELVLV